MNTQSGQKKKPVYYIYRISIYTYNNNYEYTKRTEKKNRNPPNIFCVCVYVSSFLGKMHYLKTRINNKLFE